MPYQGLVVFGLIPIPSKKVSILVKQLITVPTDLLELNFGTKKNSKTKTFSIYKHKQQQNDSFVSFNHHINFENSLIHLAKPQQTTF